MDTVQDYKYVEVHQAAGLRTLRLYTRRLFLCHNNLNVCRSVLKMFYQPVVVGAIFCCCHVLGEGS